MQLYIRRIKDYLYFPLAYYFRFFAKIRLKRWKPRIVVVTGSAGKTTLLHLIASQFQNRAKYSYSANSAFGIPFDILGLHRKTFEKKEWIRLFLSAPLCIFKKLPQEKIYIVEADCDRIGEGKFLASLLKPEVTVWLSSGRTHAMRFEKAVRQQKFATLDEAIAHEFGYFLEYARKMIIVNGDSSNIVFQLARSKAKADKIGISELQKYSVTDKGTTFMFDNKSITFQYLLPKEVYYSLQATMIVADYFNIKLDWIFAKFVLPPGRSSVFRGIKNTTLIDSSYNNDLSALKAILVMFAEMKVKQKWAVIGDILEQGSIEKQEHEEIAKILLAMDLDKIILIGPRVLKYTYPLLRNKVAETQVAIFETPKEVLTYLQTHLQGGEVILFKGARFLEGVIEHLLIDKEDIEKLPRREKVWKKRREVWNL
jgi:UDP-N-acetylmuramoyl-tripeptide--D-alanyl-D-alanine ligase